MTPLGQTVALRLLVGAYRVLRADDTARGSAYRLQWLRETHAFLAGHGVVVPPHKAMPQPPAESRPALRLVDPIPEDSE